jgi:hypothetical protein
VDFPTPVLDPKLADQWFAEAPDDQQAADRRILVSLRAQVNPRLAALQAGAGTVQELDATRELHSLRGAVASFGLTASAQYLLDLETGWARLTPAARVAGINAALDSFSEGVKLLVNRFPHLGETS